MSRSPLLTVAYRSTRISKSFLISITLTLILGGCLGPNERARELAQRSELASTIIEGTRYRHQVFYKLDPTRTLLVVFIDGDGSPWNRDGTEPSHDPTPKHPLGLELAAKTPHSTLYVGRPCYFTVRSDAGCSPKIWTSDRYSLKVVESMVAAVNRFTAEYGYKHILLIGYSGGGTLAVLMARYITSISGLVTIAANLNVAAWTHLHKYLPLEGSLDPATERPLPVSIQQLHLIGGRDQNVPEDINRQLFSTFAQNQVWRFSEFDHVCCWVEQWPSIFATIDRSMHEDK